MGHCRFYRTIYVPSKVIILKLKLVRCFVSLPPPALYAPGQCAGWKVSCMQSPKTPSPSQRNSSQEAGCLWPALSHRSYSSSPFILSTRYLGKMAF